MPIQILLIDSNGTLKHVDDISGSRSRSVKQNSDGGLDYYIWIVLSFLFWYAVYLFLLIVEDQRDPIYGLSIVFIVTVALLLFLGACFQFYGNWQYDTMFNEILLVDQFLSIPMYYSLFLAFSAPYPTQYLVGLAFSVDLIDYYFFFYWLLIQDPTSETSKGCIKNSYLLFLAPYLLLRIVKFYFLGNYFFVES